MSRLVILALRAIVILIGLGVLFGQLLLVPAFGGVLAESVLAERDVHSAPVPYVVLLVAMGACVQAALVALWVLLSMVRRDAIFSARAFRWVDVIIVAVLAATLLMLALALHWYFVVEPRLDAPGIVLVQGALVLGGVTMLLLMVVMRGLLSRATELRSELAEVV